MDNSIYIALSRQSALFSDLEISANNLANASTPGYNAQKVIFRQYLNKSNGQNQAYANDISSYRDTAKGGLRATDNPFDLAVTGPGYFMVETPGGTRYTKAGNFQLDAQGTIRTVQGYAVLGNDSAPITIPEGANRVVINGVGEVSVDGADVGQIGMAEFANEQRLKREGDTLYRADEAPQPGDNSRIVQGSIETSNVNPVAELIRVQELSRSMGGVSKFIEVNYELQRRAASAYAKSVQAQG